MDIREFYRSNQTNNQNTNRDNSFKQNTNDTYQNSPHQSKDFSEYQETINKYKDLSQDELYSELFSQATNLKSQGKLNVDMLNQISTTLNPMLNDDQKQLLNDIINKLK